MSELHHRYDLENKKYRELIERSNSKSDFYNGIFYRYKNPILTRDHIPLFWKYDLDVSSNPYFMERLGVNSVFNPGAIKINEKYYLIARVEGYDRKSFFAVAESSSPTEGFEFWDYPVVLPDTNKDETNIYDMRITSHEDGYMYGVFCSESKNHKSNDISSAIARIGIVRTKDLKNWERLDDLVTPNNSQQRNAVLHPSYVNGKYAFYTRPMENFLESGNHGGIGFGLCDDISHPIIKHEKIINFRRYHTISETKNGAGIVPIKTSHGYIHIAHGVRNTAAGLRYVIYAFATALNEPSKVIAEPSGYLIAPLDKERVGDVSNVVFTNGAIVDNHDNVYIYYGSSDTRIHVAETTLIKLIDYVFNTPEDPLRSNDSVKQRTKLIDKNLKILKK